MDKQRALDFQCWLDSGLGQCVLSEEMGYIDSLVSNFAGLYALYMGVSSMERCLAHSRAECMLEYYSFARPDHMKAVQVSYSSLPVRPQSIDGVVLHHLLDVVDDPHDVVREASQAVIPGGRILVVGFNPHSLWGAWQKLRFGRPEMAPWNSCFLSPLRVVDWLKVLGFHVDRVEHAIFDIPVSNPELRSRFNWIGKIGQRIMKPFGAVYFLSAIRREYAKIVDQTPSWNSRLVTPVPISAPSAPKTSGRCPS